MLGSVVAAVGGSASLVAVFGGSHVLADTYGEYLGSAYRQKLVEYPVFALRPLKRCLQKVSSSVFGSLDPFSMTEFIVTRLKGAEHRDWMMSRSSLRRAIITGELSMPSLVEVVSNIVGVWPLLMAYLKQTARKTDGDSLVIYYILHFCFSCNFFHMFILLFYFRNFRRRVSMATSILTRWQEANSACFICFPKFVSPASCTFLMWFTLIRIHSGNLVGNSRKLVAPFLVFRHFGKLGGINKYPLLYPFHIILGIFG